MWVGSRSSTATFWLERMLRPLQRSRPGTGQTTLVKAATVIGHPTCGVSPASQLLYLCNIMLPPVGQAAARRAWACRRQSAEGVGMAVVNRPRHAVTTCSGGRAADPRVIDSTA